MSRQQGEWRFSFKYDKKETLKVRKYQALLLELRQTYEPKYAAMSPTEGEAEWTTRTDGKAPSDNMFAKFSYKCIKLHADQGTNHGTWYLLWNPKKAKMDYHLNARCAPELFKELSNKIQARLCKEFPDHFELNWESGVSGYGMETEAGGNDERDFPIAGRGRGRGRGQIGGFRQAGHNLYRGGRGRGGLHGGYNMGGIGHGGRGGMRSNTNYNDLLKAMQALHDMQFGDHDDDSGDYCPHNMAWAFCRSCNGGGGW